MFFVISDSVTSLVRIQLPLPFFGRLPTLMGRLTVFSVNLPFVLGVVWPLLRLVFYRILDLVGTKWGLTKLFFVRYILIFLPVLAETLSKNGYIRYSLCFRASDLSILQQVHYLSRTPLPLWWKCDANLLTDGSDNILWTHKIVFSDWVFRNPFQPLAYIKEISVLFWINSSDNSLTFRF